MFGFFEVSVNHLTKTVGDVFNTTWVIRSILLDVIYGAIENHYLVVFFVLEVVLHNFLFGFE